MVVESSDMNFLLAGSPVLENFGVVGIREKAMRLRLVCQHLKCAQILMSAMVSIAVVDTPSSSGSSCGNPRRATALALG